jgi:hypothetical protein
VSLILDGSNGLSDVDGTAATPAIRGTDTNTGIFFPAADTIAFSEGGVEVARFNSSGNLQTLGTIGVGNATPSTSGAGITFPATQSASTDANTLDDYEEGTWTPVGNGVTVSGTGQYTKIGNIVSVSAQWTYPITSNTNAAQIFGLPFTSASTPANYNGCVTITSYSSDNLYVFNDIGGTTVLVRNNGNTDLTNANLSNRFVTFMATYRVA